VSNKKWQCISRRPRVLVILSACRGETNSIFQQWTGTRIKWAMVKKYNMRKKCTALDRHRIYDITIRVGLRRDVGFMCFEWTTHIRDGDNCRYVTLEKNNTDKVYAWMPIFHKKLITPISMSSIWPHRALLL